MKNTKIVICETCKKEFAAKLDHGKWPRFCCRECFKTQSGMASHKEKECPSCQSIFLAERSRFHETEDGYRTYCSTKCKNLGLRKENEFTCECCGIIFVRPDSLISRNRFCSRKCSSTILRRENASSWEGGKYKDSTTDTIRIFINNKNEGTEYIGEHRLIASKIIGRVLKPEEKILHLNRQNDDNRPENLFICKTNSEMRKRFNGTLLWPECGNLNIYK